MAMSAQRLSSARNRKFADSPLEEAVSERTGLCFRHSLPTGKNTGNCRESRRDGPGGASKRPVFSGNCQANSLDTRAGKIPRPIRESNEAADPDQGRADL